MEEIAQALGELSERVEGFNIEDLAENPAFISTVLNASQAAMRSHQEEKLEALQNAVLNSALPNAPDDDFQLVFVSYVDTLAPWHLRLLKFYSDPRKWLQQQDVPGGPPSEVLEQVLIPS